jgi:hypothetical protein
MVFQNVTNKSSTKYGGAPNDVRSATFTDGDALAHASKLLAMRPVFQPGLNAIASQSDPSSLAGHQI